MPSPRQEYKARQRISPEIIAQSLGLVFDWDKVNDEGQIPFKNFQPRSFEALVRQFLKFDKYAKSNERRLSGIEPTTSGLCLHNDYVAQCLGGMHFRTEADLGERQRLPGWSIAAIPRRGEASY